MHFHRNIILITDYIQFIVLKNGQMIAQADLLVLRNASDQFLLKKEIQEMLLKHKELQKMRIN